MEKTQARTQVRKGFREQVTDKRGKEISLKKKIMVTGRAETDSRTRREHGGKGASYEAVTRHGVSEDFRAEERWDHICTLECADNRG